MSKIINLPTYEQVEDIKTDIDNIRTLLHYEPLAVFPSVYVTYNDSNWKTMLEVNGEGYISCATVLPNNGLTFFIRVTIDGQVVVYTSSTSAVTGYTTTPSLLTNSNGGVGVVVNNTTGIGLLPMNKYEPSSIYRELGFILTAEPMMFNNSLKVEMKMNSGSFTGTFNPIILGGVK